MLSGILNNPSSSRLEKLHADGQAVALHRLTISHPGRGTKLSGTRNEIEPVIGLPAPGTDHPGAAFADIFRKCGFGSRRLPVAFQKHTNFHRDAPLGAMKGMDLAAFFGHGLVRSSEARGDTRKIFDAAASILHAVESTVGGSQQFFWRVAIGGKRGNTRAGRKSRRFALPLKFFLNLADDAPSDIPLRLPEKQGEIVPPLTLRGV